MVRWIKGILIFLVAVVAMSWWEHQQTVSFCAKIYPGLSYTDLKTLFLQSGNERYWAHQFEDKEHPGVWKVYLPDPATVGEYACKIKHDGTKVISSAYGI